VTSVSPGAGARPARGVGASAWVPGLAAVRSHRRGWLPKEVVAGPVLTALMVPQGMAYAELAGLPPSPASTPRSCACSGTPCSAPRASWCWDRTPRSGRWSPRRSCH